MLSKTIVALVFAISFSPIFAQDCTPVEPSVRTQGFWKRVTHRNHPSGEFENIPSYVDCVNNTATFGHVSSADDISDELSPRPKNDKGEQARAQFMAMLLNYCSGRVALCNCVNDPDLGLVSIEEVIETLDNIMSNPNRSTQDEVLVQAVADRINNNQNFGDCPAPPPPPVEQPPICEDDFYTTDWDTKLFVNAPGILANDVDPNGDTIEAHIYSYPSTGTLYLNRDGSFVYIPVAGVAGEVSFVYKAWDGKAYSLCTVFIEVTPGNQAPVCEDDHYTATAGTTLWVPASLGVLENDFDPEGTQLVAHGTTIVPTVGKLGLNHDGSFWYEAPADFTGTVTFVYNASDGLAKSACTVYITVVP